MAELKTYRVVMNKENQEVGVGIEQIIECTNGRPKIVFISSCYLGKCSRQETFRAYVREIINRHDRDSQILIKIADPTLRNKREWLSIYSDRITFKILPSTKFASCRLLAADALNRKTTISEQLN